MHTEVGTTWRGIPTPMDKLFFPSIGFGGGGMGQANLLVIGTPSFILLFHDVQAFCAYEETPYWSLAAESARPQHLLNLIEHTSLLTRLREFRNAPELVHFLVCGGDMCAEIVAGAYGFVEYATRAQAEAALAAKMMGAEDSFPGFRWIVPDK